MAESINVFEKTKRPRHIWIADKPLNLGGVPKQITIEQAEEKFNFKYCNNIEIPEEHQQHFQTKGNKTYHDFNDILKRLNNPLADSLVICFINEEVGWGLFTKEDIPAGTIIDIYAGKVVSKKDNPSAYGMNVAKSDLMVDAKETGNLMRFVQHMPFSLKNIADSITKENNSEKLKNILNGNHIFFRDQNVEKQKLARDNLSETKASAIGQIEKISKESGEQEEIAENYNLTKILNLATANLRFFSVEHNGINVCYLKACNFIPKNSQLGVSYGRPYWKSIGTTPQYFYKDSTTVPNNLYLPPRQKPAQNSMGRYLCYAASTGIALATGLAFWSMQSAEDNNEEGIFQTLANITQLKI